MSQVELTQDLSTRASVRRRRFLAHAGAVVATLGAGLPPAATAAVDGRRLLSLGADPEGKQDSTSAFQAAFAEADEVQVPAGTFLVGNLLLKSGQRLSGTGANSTLRMTPKGHFVLGAEAGGSAKSDAVSGLRVRNLRLEGLSESEGFEQHIHLMRLNGVTDAVIENVWFRAFQGDGIYLGGQDTKRREVHNSNVTIRSCHFDGVNRQNRNGVSIIDGDGVVIENCDFTRTSRQDMPGAIDIEPNANAFHVVRNISVRNNKISDIGGNVAAISMLVPVTLNTPVTGIEISGNRISNVDSFGIHLRMAPAESAPARQPNLTVRRNEVERARGGFLLKSVANVEVADNTFTDMRGSAEVGGAKDNEAVRNLALSNNRFVRCGTDSGAGVIMWSAVGVRWRNNEFVDAGGNKPNATAIRFVEGSTSDVVFDGNRFRNPGGAMRFAVRADPAHKSDAASTTFSGNDVASGLRVELPGARR